MKEGTRAEATTTENPQHMLAARNFIIYLASKNICLACFQDAICDVSPLRLNWIYTDTHTDANEGWYKLPFIFLFSQQKYMLQKCKKLHKHAAAGALSFTMERVLRAGWKKRKRRIGEKDSWDMWNVQDMNVVCLKNIKKMCFARIHNVCKLIRREGFFSMNFYDSKWLKRVMMALSKEKWTLA